MVRRAGRGFELYFGINFEMRDGSGICTGEISADVVGCLMSLLGGVRRFLREKFGSVKLLREMGFEPGTSRM